LFRLWLILSALWIGGVGYVTWQTFPVTPEWAVVCKIPATEPPGDCTWLDWIKVRLVSDEEQRAAIQSAILLALVPPVIVLALGSALAWAIRGFRQP
jgi:hypothetical protein